jgi:hypothetical protein
MAAPDLTFARLQATSLMTDECVITTDPGTSNDGFDYDTGIVIPGTPQTLYTGVCMIISRARPTGTRAGILDYEGGHPAVIQIPEIRIPFDAPEVPIGANIVITASQDPTTVDHRYVVRDTNYGTYIPWRVLSCNRWVAGQTLPHIVEVV